MKHTHFTCATAVAFIAMLSTGCGDSNNVDFVDTTAPQTEEILSRPAINSGLCNAPISIEGDANEFAIGFRVYINSSLDVFEETSKLQAGYDSLEIFSVSGDCNCFLADTDDTTLEQLRCEDSISRITYDLDAI